jgi:hypothetical protein
VTHDATGNTAVGRLLALLLLFLLAWPNDVAARFLSVDPVPAQNADGGNFNRYHYAAGNPFKYRDPDGRFIDSVFDVGFAAYSAYTLARDPSWRNAGALSADVAAIFIPGVTGLGVGVRATGHGADTLRQVSGPPDKGKLPDRAAVCRGGSCTADRFANGSGVSLDPGGRLQNVSVNSAPGKPLDILAAGIPNGQIGATTVGAIRKAGGDVVPSPTANNPHHCTMCGITPQQAQDLFTPTRRNPDR